MMKLQDTDSKTPAAIPPVALGFDRPEMPISVLVLDDDAFDRRRIRRLSERFRMEVDLSEVASLEELSRLIPSRSFDLILIDYNLREGCGFEALDIVRADPRHRRCPIIMVAGEERVSIAVDAMKLGFFDFVSKSDLSVDRLESAIATAISDRRTRGSGLNERSQEVEDMVDRFLTDQLRGLQPGFDQMLADMRQLRSDLQGNRKVFDDLGALEAKLVFIWNLLKASRSGRLLH